jgi:hypothetical protein
MLQIFDDVECPEFCPMNHLLVYVAMSGIQQSGPLFPSFKEQKFSDVPWEYKDWLAKLWFLFE